MAWHNVWRMEPIGSMGDLVERAGQYGFLPMFRCSIRGYSVYEATPHFWTDDEDGPWEWKGPIIRDGECAYGKFFKRKAVWISREWLPDFINYRRTKHYAPNEDAAALDEIVLQTIEAEGSITSKILAELLGISGRKKKRRPEDLVDDMPVGEKISLDPILARLMMEGRVVIADFVYNIDKRGNRYGWGMAKYSTPENLYGIIRSNRSPEESYERMLAHIIGMVPVATEAQVRKLLG
ncbi:MAG: hypothetical protein NC111_05845 [Bacteroides sp.]|nr:hypothetical protein [Bacteroides sp.]MCM1414210.1 hypothetical protein [Bacteroides sp.]MCM1472032.1 hypothetical protein [Bacteroides sp.]